MVMVMVMMGSRVGRWEWEGGGGKKNTYLFLVRVSCLLTKQERNDQWSLEEKRF